MSAKYYAANLLRYKTPRAFARRHLENYGVFKMNAVSEVINQIKDYRLKINVPFQKQNGKWRTNKLTAYMVGDQMQLYIDNGHDPEGKDMHSCVRLSQDHMKQLVEFVQRNIK